ncbi:hypothetical protein FPV67DRAFT_1672210 [Lyophyllum atratum]|nr:hypothetical protein FPV67DRAFT_1672210 [Lyophyllum atratum]
MPVDKTLISRLSAEWALRSFQQQKNSATLGVLPTRTVTWKPSAASRVRVDEILQRAWKKSTSGKYASAVDDFVRFCTAHSVPLSEALPASEPLLCAYASTFAGVLAGGTVRGKMSALRSWHIQNGLPWHSSLQLKYIIRGIENMRPVESIRPPRPPVSIQMIESLSQTLSSTDPFDVCVLALATTCFWGQIRLGEILPNREIGYDAALFPRWSDLKVPNARGSRVLHLPSTKTGGTFGEDVMITRQLSPFDPIAALEAHAVINHLNGSTSLASYVSSAGMGEGSHSSAGTAFALVVLLSSFWLASPPIS